MSFPCSRSAATRLSARLWPLLSPEDAVEAAVRCGRPEIAQAAFDDFAPLPTAAGTPWALGVMARCQALLAGDDPGADDNYQQSIGYLQDTPVVLALARSRLVYGEWLRRESRRIDAREQLRAAREALLSMGADGFAERARHELLATGEKVRKRRDDTREDLTPQEEHIARLAREGRTNPEISAELFLSPRTVEWHLKKVFAKLGITSRRELRDALPLEPTVV